MKTFNVIVNKPATVILNYTVKAKDEQLALQSVINGDVEVDEDGVVWDVNEDVEFLNYEVVEVKPN